MGGDRVSGEPGVESGDSESGLRRGFDGELSRTAQSSRGAGLAHSS